jgi:hypothetical protein
MELIHSNLDIENKIRVLAQNYSVSLKNKMDDRVVEMDADDNSHYLIYRVLGVCLEEGKKIDIYQNKGRFLYNKAGAFLEKAAKICFKEKFSDAATVKIPNTLGLKPKNFEIDCLVSERDAIEIKWRDATTDGDHIIKEHTRIQNIAAAGFKPIRVMFYYPNRSQAIKIQQALETLYLGINGEYHYGLNAWKFIYDYTSVDLKTILETIAEETVPSV